MSETAEWWKIETRLRGRTICMAVLEPYHVVLHLDDGSELLIEVPEDSAMLAIEWTPTAYAVRSGE